MINRYRRFSLLLFIIAALLGFISIEVIYAAPKPDVELDVPQNAFIGDVFEFSATFSNNAANDIGYGPFMDLWLPRNGADGAAGAATPDGITFIEAQYLDTPVKATLFTFPAGGCLNHPYLRDASLKPVQVCGISGDQFAVLELPFGSFIPNQPPVEVIVRAQVSDLADLNVPLMIRARGGFRFGQDPVDNPCCDQPITSPEVNAPVTPVLMTISKANDAAESEIPAGPNFTSHWTITVDIADGQTITDLAITDHLPPNITYVDVTTAAPPLSGAPAVNGADVTFPVASVTGGAGDQDVSIEFSFYADNVLDPTTGTLQQIYNTMDAVGTWQPNDPRDAGFPGNAAASGACDATSCPGGDAPYLVSFAAQKSVQPLTSPVRPGTVLEYTVDFELSDFYAVGEATLTDTISDGQHLDTTFAPHIIYTQHGVTQNVNLDPANYDVLEYWTGGNPGTPAPAPTENGDTVLQIRISDQVGIPLLGGCIPPAGTPTLDCGVFNSGPTTGQLVYRTTILDTFVDNFPSGDASVDDGDILNNQILLRGQLLNPANFSPAGYSQTTNDSKTKINIERGDLTKTIFAINGTTCGACNNITVSAGDTVTYRLRQEMPASDFEKLRLVDYLPLPVYDAQEIIDFVYTVDGSIPPAGAAKFFTDDTLYNLMQTVRPGSPPYPVLQANATDNTLRFNYGDEFDDPLNRNSIIDLVFTVTVTGQPFADGLALTNILQSKEASTNAGDDAVEVITQVQVTSPLLLMTKGVVATSNPNGQFSPINPGPVSFNQPGSADPFSGTITSDSLVAAPVNSDISNIGIGDTLTFAIVIENAGSSPQGVFDIQIRDTLSPGFAIPDAGLNLQAHLGNGITVNYQPLGSSNTERDLFDQGIELIDPGIDGVCGPYSGTDGLNIVVITYDLKVTALTQAVLTNTAAVINYASTEGGVDHTANQDIIDTAQVNLLGGGGANGTAQITKSVDKPFAQPGERLVWKIEIANSGSTSLADVSVVDTLPDEIEPLSAITTRGTVLLAGQGYTFTIGTLAPGEQVYLTITSRIRLTAQTPYTLVNTAVLFSGATELNRATATVISATTLPSTGEKHHGVQLLQLSTATGGISLLLTAAYLIWRVNFSRQ